MRSLNYLRNHIPYQNIQIYFEYVIKKHEIMADNPLVRICVNKTENRITFRIKSGYYLEVLTHGTMKLLENNKNKITKNENGENLPHLEIKEVVLVHSNIVDNCYQHNARVLYNFFPNKLFRQLLDISLKNFIALETFN